MAGLMMSSRKSQAIKERIKRYRGDVELLLRVAIDEEDRARIRFVYGKMMPEIDPEGWRKVMDRFIHGASVEEMVAFTGWPRWQVEVVYNQSDEPTNKAIAALLDKGCSIAQIEEQLHQSRRRIGGVASGRTKAFNRDNPKHERPKPLDYLVGEMSCSQIMGAYIAKPFGYQWKKMTG